MTAGDVAARWRAPPRASRHPRQCGRGRPAHVLRSVLPDAVVRVGVRRNIAEAGARRAARRRLMRFARIVSGIRFVSVIQVVRPGIVSDVRRTDEASVTGTPRDETLVADAPIPDAATEVTASGVSGSPNAPTEAATGNESTPIDATPTCPHRGPCGITSRPEHEEDRKKEDGQAAASGSTRRHGVQVSHLRSCVQTPRSPTRTRWCGLSTNGRTMR